MASLRSKFVWTGILVLCAVLPVIARHVGQKHQKDLASGDAGRPDGSGRVGR